MAQQTAKKKRKLKPIVQDSVFCLGGLVMGEVVASLVKDIAFLKWLSFEVLYGIDKPISFNLLLLKFEFGGTLRLTPALILFGFLGILLSRLMQASATESKVKARAYDLRPDKSEEYDDEEDDFEEDEEVEVDDSQQFDR
jgi:hypothetical protein